MRQARSEKALPILLNQLELRPGNAWTEGAILSVRRLIPHLLPHAPDLASLDGSSLVSPRRSHECQHIGNLRVAQSAGEIRHSQLGWRGPGGRHRGAVKDDVDEGCGIVPIHYLASGE